MEKSRYCNTPSKGKQSLKSGRFLLSVIKYLKVFHIFVFKVSRKITPEWWNFRFLGESIIAEDFKFKEERQEKKKLFNSKILPTFIGLCVKFLLVNRLHFFLRHSTTSCYYRKVCPCLATRSLPWQRTPLGTLGRKPTQSRLFSCLPVNFHSVKSLQKSDGQKRTKTGRIKDRTDQRSKETLTFDVSKVKDFWSSWTHESAWWFSSCLFIASIPSLQLNSASEATNRQHR